MSRSRPLRVHPAKPRSAAARLAEAERLYLDFAALTPFPQPRPFTKAFDSFADYERWRRAQPNPWNR